MEGSIDSWRDVEIINLSSSWPIWRRWRKGSKTKNLAKSGDKKLLAELDLYQKIQEDWKRASVRALSFSKEARTGPRSLC